MKTSDRDLLVLVKDEYMNEKFIENELERLNEMLFHYETIEKFCTVHEIFDLNKSKIIDKPQPMQQLIRQKQLKPFQFVCNKN
jgi:F0F1-type ATP synthase alpha subunit